MLLEKFVVANRSATELGLCPSMGCHWIWFESGKEVTGKGLLF